MNASNVEPWFILLAIPQTKKFGRRNFFLEKKMSPASKTRTARVRTQRWTCLAWLQRAAWAGLVMMAVFSAVPAFGNTITVTDTSDSSPNSLRAAIADAAPGDTINFSLTLPATITLTSGELLISKNLTISGPGASSLALSGNSASRVFEIASGTSVAISGLTIQSGNAGGGNGGGISNVGTLTLMNSILSGNSSSNGGGIYNAGTLTVMNNTLSSNSSPFGGGIFNGGTLSVSNSTLWGNSASVTGGGIDNIGTLAVTNSTLSGNSSSTYPGGGIYNGAGTLNVSSSTFSGNSAGQIWVNGGTGIVKDSIVANSASGNCAAGAGTFTSEGYNLSDDGSCTSFLNQTGDLNSTPAGLDPSGLQNNGGYTQTIALLATSPAIADIPLNPTNHCTDVNGAPVATDQRGVTRPQQATACDIGAFELSTDNDKQFSLLNGGNTFTGNQSVNGNLTATNFVGNGAGLTGVNAATANTANTANFATNAADAHSLGGIPAPNYARLDVGNNFSGNENFAGSVSAGSVIAGAIGVTGTITANGTIASNNNLTAAGEVNAANVVAATNVSTRTLTISGGTPIAGHLSQTPAITVRSISPKNCAPIIPLPFTGAADGDTVALGVTNKLTSGGALTYFAWVGAPGTISVKICNPFGPSSPPLSDTIRVDVWKH